MSELVQSGMPCPIEGCGSSDAYAIYDNDGGLWGHCFSCGGNRPEGGQEKDMQLDMFTIYNQLPSVDLQDRGISQATCLHFGVKASVDAATGQVDHHFYPRTLNNALVGYQARNTVDKKFWMIGHTGPCDPFGYMQAAVAGSQTLIITEGQVDAMSIYEAVVQHQKGTAYADRLPAVISINNGAQGARSSLTPYLEWVSSFQKVIVFFDSDEPGMLAQDEVCSLLPTGVAYVVKPTYKDANEYMQRGKPKALAKMVLFQAKPYTISGIATVEEVLESAVKLPERGKPWPWPSLTRMTYGIRPELIGLGAGVGIGKSRWLFEILKGWIQEGIVPGVFMFENNIGDIAVRVASATSGKKYFEPDAGWSIEEREQGIRDVADKMVIVKRGLATDWEWVRERIRQFVMVHGVRGVVLDPLTALVAHLSSGEANDALNSMMRELAAMVDEFQIPILYTSHLNPPQSGPPHEEGGKVKEYQFTGSRAMIKWSHYILGLERNKYADNEIERNMVTCRVLKDRVYGNTGHFALYYDGSDGSFNEPDFDYKPEGQEATPTPHVSLPGD